MKTLDGVVPGTTDGEGLTAPTTYGDEKTTRAEISVNVQQAQSMNRWDPNLPLDNEEIITASPQIVEDKAVIGIEKLPLEDSPYESVRAAVRNTDGEEVANTVRAWIFGMLFVTIASGINMFLSMRSPATVIS
ncbi:hypothetical protein B7463_g11435, partial [Scytalidium lignicola]